MSRSLASFTVFMAILVVAAGYDCGDVYDSFRWCEAFVEGGYDDVPYTCCNGLAKLNEVSKRDEYGGVARICQCIENIAASGPHPPFSESRIEGLYSRCNIHLNFPISEHMDCSRLY